MYFSWQLFIITFTHVCMIAIYDVILTCGRSSDLRDCRDGPMRIGQAIRVIPLVRQSARMYICSFLEFH